MKQSVDPGDEVVPGSQGSGVEGEGKEKMTRRCKCVVEKGKSKNLV